MNQLQIAASAGPCAPRGSSAGGVTTPHHRRPSSSRSTLSQSRRTPAVRASSSRLDDIQDTALESLVPQSLEELREDESAQALMADLAEKGQAQLTREERKARQRSLDSLNVPSFQKFVTDAGVTPLKRGATEILQLNIGLYCNQACSHCHVESSPLRKEMMDRRTAERCMELLAASPGISTVDITGGAPELNSEFRYIVEQSRALGKEVLDRCNLTVLLEPGQEGLVDFLAENKVHVVASMPCYSEANVDQQRGRGVFERSIIGLQKLNAAGFGVEGTGLQLDLVYNPGGAFLAPSQSALEPAYKRELSDAYGITFNSLIALNNMPIKRFHDYLKREDKLEEYLELLVQSFNPAAAEGIMCRNITSVGWDGRLYDCDFNQQLEMGISSPEGSLSVFDIGSLEELEGRAIYCDNHCFGCTAGAGSSCSGATS